MARKNTKTKTFSQRMEEYAKNVLGDAQKVRIAKNSYLLDNKDAILRAKVVGYTYAQIAEVATIALLEKNIPISFVVKNKEGEEKTVKTKFYPIDIKNFCEAEEK